MNANTERLGLVFVPPGRGWARTHGQNPFGQDLGDGRVRLHFACRDENNRSRGACVDVAWETLVNPSGPIPGDPRMTLDLGTLGAFDDSGAMPSAVVEKAGTEYLYYTGWSLARTVPFSFHIGLAVSSDHGGSFERISQAPVLGRHHHDPFITGAPWVLIENGIFRMWYISGTGWEPRSDGVRHYYTVKYAESDDGISWKTSDHRCIDYGPEEYALARPIVTKTRSGYLMLFSFRGGSNTYRIGSAESSDGVTWTRRVGAFFDAAAEGWDSQMVCYGWPFHHARGSYLLYNGNNYGRDGFGLARLNNDHAILPADHE